MTFRNLATVGGIAVALALPASAARAQSPFPDVPPNHWAADAVGKLGEAGILKGYPRGSAQRAGDRGYDGNRPVTRYELAVTLWRFVQYIEGADRQKRSSVAPGASVAGGANVTPGPDAASGPDALKRLVSGGYLPQNTPLARQGNQPVTANQLADALAQVITRVTERRTPVPPGEAPPAQPRPAP